MIVSKKLSFDAAHFLPNYEGKCKDVHGHTWKVEVACSGDLREDTGMVVDFKELKKFLEWVEDRFDHKLLNDFIKNPTAENISKYIFDEFNLWCVGKGLEPMIKEKYKIEEFELNIE